MALINPTGGANKLNILAEAVIGATQSFVGQQVEPVIFGTTVFNNGFLFDGSTVTIQKTAKYAIGLKLRGDNTTSSTTSVARLRLNGTDINTTILVGPSIASFGVSDYLELELTAGDTITFGLVMNGTGGGILNTNAAQQCRFSIVEI